MKITPKQIEKFRAAVLNCDSVFCDSFLEKAETFQFSNVKILLAFHDALLLLEAYPATVELYDRANILLRNFEILTKRFLRGNKSAAEKLVNSGLRGTEVHGAFTYLLLWEPAAEKSKALFLHSIDEEGIPVADVLRHYLPLAEFDALNADSTNEEVLETLFGKEFPLHGLIYAMTVSRATRALRDQLFDQMKIFAGLRLDGSIPDRSTARGLVHEIFVQDALEKKANAAEVISRSLPPPENLTHEQNIQLRKHAMFMLATLNRETDPITSSDILSQTLFQLERGVSIALFSSLPELRMPFESYIGYMLYRNGVPIAYGGAWIFGNRALFGINIFEPFRGGESALTILQLLRVYHQYYGVEAFSVEPYQFGKDNPEGIESGAYWFYYKMGFRSDDKQLAALAEKEFAKMTKKKTYRSSHATLRKFTESRITWRISSGVLFPDPSAVSSRITEMIRKKFDGDRLAAIKKAMNGEDWGGDFIHSFALWYLSRGHSFDEYSGKIAELNHLKGISERDYNHFLIANSADYQ